MEMTDVIGWISSFILVATLSKQVWKQWTTKSHEGVSMWLFIGETAAQIGFIWYSILLGNAVFIFTNAVLLFVGILGLIVHFRNLRGGDGDPGLSAPPAKP